MSQQATAQDVRGEDFRLHKLRPSAEAFGAVVDFLSRVKPFSEYTAGLLTTAVRAQLRDQHHVCAMRGNTMIGYCGWVLTSKEIGDRWARERTPLKTIPDSQADAGALTLVRADEPKVLRRLIRATRELNPGRRVFFLREYADGLKKARQATVLNVPHTRKAAKSG